MAVDKNYLKKNIGVKLMNGIEQVCLKEGVKSIRAGTYFDN